MNWLNNLLAAFLIWILILSSYTYLTYNKIFNNNVIVNGIPINIDWDYKIKVYNTKDIIVIMNNIRYLQNNKQITITNVDSIYDWKYLKDLDINDIKEIFNTTHIYSYIWVDWKKYHNLLK